MKKILLTLLIALAVAIAGFYLFISSGAYNISQLAHHNRLTLSIIRKTTHNSIQRRIKTVVVPDNLNDTTLLITGFKHYQEMCLVCHGAPGTNPSEMTAGLYPKPPLIYKHAEEGDAREFFWIIKNGIKFTSMPAFQPTHDDAKIWAITAFVTHKLPKMTPEEYRDWLSRYGAENDDD